MEGAMQSGNHGLLSGIKVVEMGIWVPGPAVAAVLGDWGADVIKIENPAGGDPVCGRSGGTFVGVRPQARDVNPESSLTVDPSRPSGNLSVRIGFNLSALPLAGSFPPSIATASATLPTDRASALQSDHSVDSAAEIVNR